MANRKFLNALKLAGKIVFTALLVYLVFQKIDLAVLGRTLASSEPGWLVLALVLYLLSQVISSWRLHGLLLVMGIPIGFGFNLRLYLLGMFYNVFLPGGIGGDGYKLYLLKKKFGTPAKTLLTAFLLDRASGLWAITVLVATAAFFLPVLDLPPWMPPTYIVAALAGFYICWRLMFIKHIRYFPTGIARALIVQSMQCVAMACILHALHLPDGYLPYLFSFLLGTIATVIPVSIGGLGLREYVMVQLSPLLLLDEATAVSASFCFYLISTLAAIPGLWFVYRSKEFAANPSTRGKQETIDEKNGGL